MRKRKAPLPAVDALWLAEYDEEAEKAKRARRPLEVGKDTGASRSGRRVQLDIQEEAESVGTGSAAAVAAAAALTAKEEGRRLDSLTINAVDALKEAVDVYRQICLSLRERTEVLEATHIEMLQAIRGEYLARTNAEVALAAAAEQGEGGVAEGMLMKLLEGWQRKQEREKVKRGAKPAASSAV